MKELILALAVIVTVAGLAMASAAESLEPGWLSPAWVQAIGSVVAILIAVWVSTRQFNQTQRMAKEQRNHDAREDKLKARSLALALLPELFEMKAKIEGARSNDGTINIEILDIPPVLIGSIERLYLLGDAGGEIQQFVAVTRTFNRMVEVGRNRLLGNEHAERAALRATLQGPLTMMESTLADALERIEPIHDGKS